MMFSPALWRLDCLFSPVLWRLGAESISVPRLFVLPRVVASRRRINLGASIVCSPPCRGVSAQKVLLQTGGNASAHGTPLFGERLGGATRALEEALHNELAAKVRFV